MSMLLAAMIWLFSLRLTLSPTSSVTLPVSAKIWPWGTIRLASTSSPLGSRVLLSANWTLPLLMR